MRVDRFGGGPVVAVELSGMFVERAESEEVANDVAAALALGFGFINEVRVRS